MIPKRNLILISIIFFSIQWIILSINSSVIAKEAGKSRTDIRLSLGPVYQSTSNVTSFSSFNVTRFALEIDKTLKKNRKSILNIGFSYGHSDYSFSGPSSDIWSDPWERVHGMGISGNYIIFTKSRLSARFGVSLDWSWEEGARLSDALTPGGMASVSYSFRFDRTIGIGFGVYNGLDKTTIFPFLAVSWKITDHLSIGNPLRVGPAGPAGLEFRYDINELWQIGCGGAYRSSRFRLDDGGISHGGVGSLKGIPAWVRVSRKMGNRLRLNFYSGALFDGRVRIDSDSGGEISTKGFDTTFIGALIFDIRI